MKEFFDFSVVRPRRRLLPIIGMVLLFSAGIIGASAFFTPYPSGLFKWSEIILSGSLALLLLFSGGILLILSYRTTLTIDLFDWLRDHDNNLSTLAAPLNSSNLYPVCEKLTSLFPDNAGWIFLLRAPGLLIRGEVKRRKYLAVASDQLDEGWNISLVENYLKDLIERETDEYSRRKERISSLTQSPDTAWTGKWADESLRPTMDLASGPKQARKPIGRRSTSKPMYKTMELPIIFLTSHLRAGDISSGIAIALKKRRTSPDSIMMHALSTGLDLFAQRIGSILVEVIQRREGLGLESLGLVMRVLAHEINNDLQGALNRMDASLPTATPQTESLFLKIRSLLARANHWSHIMREAPFLADDMLPVERNVVSLTTILRGTLDEVRSAWPDTAFSIEFPDTDGDIMVIGDHHLRTIIRNLLHNAASFSPVEGMVEVSIVEDGENAHLVVQDEGPGVDPLDMDRIFSPLGSLREAPEASEVPGVGKYSFYFAEEYKHSHGDSDEDKESRKEGVKVSQGMGVGLTISRAIARAYGGDLRCQNNLDAAGGKFILVLQLAANE